MHICEVGGGGVGPLAAARVGRRLRNPVFLAATSLPYIGVTVEIA